LIKLLTVAIMWDIFSRILDIMLVVITAYFYFENRQLKKFKAEKELEIKMAELAKVRNDYFQNSPGTVGYELLSMSDIVKRENEFNYKVLCIEAEIKNLGKIIKKYQWIFSK